MESGRGKRMNRLWLLVTNIVVAAAMVLTLGLYAASNTNQKQADNREALRKSAANVSDQVQLYFISQHRNLYNHHHYICPENGDKLTYDEALTYLQKANADETVNYQVIDPDTYTGVSLVGGEAVPVNYTYDSYTTIRHACDLVRAGDVRHDIIGSTASFANASKGTASSIALYTDIVVSMGGGEKSYALFAVIRTEDLAYSGLPSLSYDGAGACIVDKNNDYIVKDDISFRNSENFIKFLRVYNSLTYPQADAIAEGMLRDGAGILAYNDFRGDPCYYAYHAISGTDGWHYVASVPVASMERSNIDYIFSLILLVFLIILIALNSLWMRHLNNLLRSNIKSLDEARKAADAANNAKTFFLAHMSHEMRTPLNAIIGMGALVQGKSDDPEVASLLTKMTSASEHLLGIINDVLDISKIGEGKLTLHPEPFSIEEMCKALAAIYGISAGERGISLTFDTDIAIGRYIMGDEIRLRQVMTNLISNAIKYNNRGGYAKVLIRRLDDATGDTARVLFQIEDNGFGISQDKQKDVFEPFTRDYTDHTKAIAGTGLGLAISNELVTAMGGEIKLESTLGKGSKFWFELEFPLGEKIVPIVEDVKPQWDENSLAGISILVAEDNDMNAFIVENLLLRVGAQVALASNGQEAVDLMAAGPPGRFDIILMDILMPVMDGYEAAARIRALDGDYYRGIPIMALSANAFKEDVELSLARGMQAHLVKPIDMDALYAAVLELTRNKAE